MKKLLPIIIFLAIITALIYIFRDRIFTPRSYGDLHMHTTCSDGKNTYEEMIQAAIKDKLNFVAITDHKYCADAIAKCPTETRITCFPGQEVTTSRVHLLAINIKGYIDPNLSLIERVKAIHTQGGIAIAAHPNSKDYYYTDSELKDSGIDAQECTNDSKERRFLPCVWDSDAHSINDSAWQFNSCSASIKNVYDLKNAILNHKCGRAIRLQLHSLNRE